MVSAVGCFGYFDPIQDASGGIGASMKYTVQKQHEAERIYLEGDVRELDELTAASLLEAGYLSPVTSHESASSSVKAKSVKNEAND